MEIEILPKIHSVTSLNAHLILRRDDNVLFLLRKNTGYCDGFYGVVSGHVENDESAVTAMVREAKEEAGIVIEPEALRVVHMMHRRTNRYNMDIFFECSNWEGEINNQEPHKCASLDFLSPDNLPINVLEFIKDALHSISKNEFYSEKGWN